METKLIIEYHYKNGDMAAYSLDESFAGLSIEDIFSDWQESWMKEGSHISIKLDTQGA